MAVPRLVPYIKQQLSTGYDIHTVRNHLIAHGYDAKEVNDAVDHIYKDPEKGFPLLAVVGGIIAAAAIIFILFLTLGGEDVPEQLLDLSTSSLTDDINPGDTISFNIELINMGNAKRYDVSLTHELRDSQGNVILPQQETMALETRSSKTSEILIPDEAAPGRYTVRTVAQYNGESAVSFFTVNVKEKEVEVPIPVEKECPASCDDYKDCTKDICGQDTDFECVNEQIIPCCGNEICETREDNSNCPFDCEEIVITPPKKETTISEVVDDAKDMAKSDPNKAANYCKNQEEDRFKDSCHSAVAEVAEDSKYCDTIISDTKRDSCYTTAALRGDFEVCAKITNKYLKQSCESLAEASL